VDVYAAVGNSSDKFLNVYNTNISTTNAGGFYQQPGFSTKTWKPDAANFNSTRSSIDSFMTAGTYSGGAYGGEYYSSTNTNGDPNFTGTSWNATPASAAATTIPALAGWYTGDPTSVDNAAQLLAPLSVGYTRFDSGTNAGTAGSGTAQYGIWCSHLVLANATLANFQICFGGSAYIKDGVTGSISAGISAFDLCIPAPGAIALLGVGGVAVRRRRR
jgi:hypothetical protein